MVLMTSWSALELEGAVEPMASVLVLAGAPPAAKTANTVRETVFSKGGA
jgi:hypothetical protein